MKTILTTALIMLALCVSAADRIKVNRETEIACTEKTVRVITTNTETLDGILNFTNQKKYTVEIKQDRLGEYRQYTVSFKLAELSKIKQYFNVK